MHCKSMPNLADASFGKGHGSEIALACSVEGHGQESRMPTPKFDAILASRASPVTDSLRNALDAARTYAEHAERFEPLIASEVLEAIALLERDDEFLDRWQIEVTVSLRDGGQDVWKHFGTRWPMPMARPVLEDFVAIRLQFGYWVESMEHGVEPASIEMSNGAASRW